METIRLLPILHRGAEQILLQYDKSEKLNHLARGIKSVKWSQSHKGWYLPLTQESYQAIQQEFVHLAILDSTALSKYLHQRKAVQATKPAKTPIIKCGAEKLPVKPELNNTTAIRKQPPLPQPEVAFKLALPNLEALQKMMDQLTLKAYSDSTKRTYRGEMLVFLQLLGRHAAETLTTDDVKRYLLKCIGEGLSENTVHSRINALKFFYEQVLGRDKFFVEIPRPKKQQQLPKVFNQDDIANIINSCKNLKHKTMLMLSYSGGLRVSEVVSLKTMAIDSKRMTIFLERAKGKKDRIVPLSPVLLVMLREYWNQYKPAVKGYLFPGQMPNQPYSTRSLQLVLQAAKQKAGILRPGSIHTLRHSFATHLLEKGTDVTMIMKLLGHNDLKTTLRYLHVTNRDILQIVSPLDSLDLK
ncbi:MAG: tyrosine-type recombinase/integrase [Bacteroidota bacterium]